MQWAHGFWTSLTYVVNLFSLSSINGPGLEKQDPLGLHSGEAHVSNHLGPIFKPPGGRVTGDGSEFVCNYTNMVGWEFCSTPEDRTCWLKKPGGRIDIHTNYEDFAPKGIERFYEVDATDDTSLNLDGVDFDGAKLFNRKYPGPWIQACWGDTVTVKVNNWMKINGGNGTSIHWHGVRQLNSTHMDGVNGITQCPIAPGDSFTYSWKVMQYGTSWYHSHFSVQYADGLLGPLTLHGPTIAPYDQAISPLLITDWGHASAFEAIQTGTFKNPSILLNGAGNATRFNKDLTPLDQTHDIPTPYTLQFDPKPINGRPRRYLLRIINTSFASTFVFSIDNHLLQVVGADFVPVHNYTTKSILVAIGQRYHVIVEAAPQPDEGWANEHRNFWIRTWEASCTDFAPIPTEDYELAGILRYSDSQHRPNSTEWEVDQTCADEYWESINPVVPWNVGLPANGPPGGLGESLSVIFERHPSIFPLARASMGGDTFNPLYIDYGSPTFLKLNYTGKWDPLWVVFPENYNGSSWVYYTIKSGFRHPIHLHGHDFAIFHDVDGSGDIKKLNRTNPPRRDVVLPPQTGNLVIAFKTDNPGTWLMHCHIAFHASFGLAMQILERQEDAANLWPSSELSPALRETQRVCDGWNRWWGDCRDWWPGSGKSCGIGEDGFAPDSGI